MRDTLKQGSRGADTRYLQGLLITLGAPLNDDGIFGELTDEVVREFQGWRKLVVDGIVGPKTWDELDRCIAKHMHLMHERDGIDPCSAAEALSRMEQLKLVLDAEYKLGTGDYSKGKPFAKRYDCAGAAICEAYKLTRHRLGFASGVPPYEFMNDVDDDINTNSALEDAFKRQELFTIVPDGDPILPGDLVMWATIHLHVGGGDDVKTFLGHVVMVKSVPHGWTPDEGWHHVRLLQCCGGNGRKPAIIETDGHVIDKHNDTWAKDGMRAYVVRVRQISR